jgi:hypothetical protein
MGDCRCPSRPARADREVVTSRTRWMPDHESAPPNWTDEQLCERVEAFLAKVARDHPELCEAIPDKGDTLH